MLSIANYYILKKEEYDQLQSEHKELNTLKKAINEISGFCSPIGPQHAAGWNGALSHLKSKLSGYSEWMK